MWEREVSSYYACVGIEKCESHCSSDVPVTIQCSSAGQKLGNTGKKNHSGRKKSFTHNAMQVTFSANIFSKTNLRCELLLQEGGILHWYSNKAHSFSS